MKTLLASPLVMCHVYLTSHSREHKRQKKSPVNLSLCVYVCMCNFVLFLAKESPRDEQMKLSHLAFILYVCVMKYIYHPVKGRISKEVAVTSKETGCKKRPLQGSKKSPKVDKRHLGQNEMQDWVCVCVCIRFVFFFCSSRVCKFNYALERVELSCFALSFSIGFEREREKE